MKRSIVFAAMVSFAWLIVSGFVDFVVVPSAFKMVSEAGKLGIHVFWAINKLEFIFGLMLTAFVWFGAVKLQWVFRSLAMTCFLLAIFYNFFLTPQIIELSEYLWMPHTEVKEMGIDLLHIQEQHGFYHQLYVILDSVKLLILLVLSFWLPFQVKLGESA